MAKNKKITKNVLINDYKKKLAGGLITQGLRMILKDPASKKALKDLTKLGRDWCF